MFLSTLSCFTSVGRQHLVNLNFIVLKETICSFVLVQREMEDSGFKLSYNLSIKGCASRVDFNGFFKA
jgi:hypothetical protein